MATNLHLQLATLAFSSAVPTPAASRPHARHPRRGRLPARDRCRRPHLLLPRGRSLPAPVWAVHPAQPPGRAPAPPAAPWPRLPPLLCCSPAALSGNTAPMSGRAPLCHHAPAPWPAPCCCLAPGRCTGPPPAFACRGRPASPAVATASSRVLASKPHPRGPSPVRVRP